MNALREIPLSDMFEPLPSICDPTTFIFLSPIFPEPNLCTDIGVIMNVSRMPSNNPQIVGISIYLFKVREMTVL